MIRLAQQYGAEYLIFRQAGGQQRVEKLLRLAIIASKPGASNQTFIAKAIDDPDPVARYWAALAMQGITSNSPKDLELLFKAGQDKNPCVRIAAAWSLSFLGEGNKAVAILEGELTKADQTDEVLQFALKVLDLLGPESRAALETVKTLDDQKTSNKYIGRIQKRFIEKFQKFR